MKGKKLSGKQEQQMVPTLLIYTLIVAQMCLPSPQLSFHTSTILFFNGINVLGSREEI